MSTIPIHAEGDAFNAMSLAMHMARQIGFAKLESNLIATAVSEIAINVVRYAYKGMVTIDVTKNKRGISIIVEDEGPGIPDIKKAMQDGYSTQKTSLGLGIGAAKRAMDEFRIRSVRGRGTKVTMRKYLPIPASVIEYGVVTLADAHYVFNGDAYVIREFEGDKVLLAVIDGLGQGEKAYRSAIMAREIIEASYDRPLDTIVQKCDKALKGKEDMLGASIELLLVTPRQLQYAGVGDAFIQVFAQEKFFFASQPGIVGAFRLPKIKVIRKPYNHAQAVMVLCTDGIHNHFNTDDLPLHGSAQFIADYIMKHYRRAFGDATVQVVKLKDYAV